MVNHPDYEALKAAKEITVACLNSANVTPTKDSGEGVADFFEAVYKRVMEIASAPD